MIGFNVIRAASSTPTTLGMPTTKRGIVDLSVSFCGVVADAVAAQQYCEIRAVHNPKLGVTRRMTQPKRAFGYAGALRTSAAPMTGYLARVRGAGIWRFMYLFVRRAWVGLRLLWPRLPLRFETSSFMMTEGGRGLKLSTRSDSNFARISRVPC